MMVLKNKRGQLALLFKQKAPWLWIVTLPRHTLCVQRISIQRFKRNWRPAAYELPLALSRFRRHAARHGATRHALTALKQLEGTA